MISEASPEGDAENPLPTVTLALETFGLHLCLHVSSQLP